MRGRRVGGLLLFLGLLGACSDSSSDTSSDETTATTTPPGAAHTSLSQNEYVAACLTDETDEPDGPIQVDLCVGDLDGRVQIIREDIDPAIGPAVSPDGRRVAFVEGGRLHLVDADGSGETDLAVSTTAPEWFSNDEIAYLAVDGRSVGLITDTGVEGKQLVDAAALDRLGDGWTIESLAVSPENQTIALSIFRNDGAESGIALVGADGGASMLIGPMADPLTGPAFSPDGQALAYVRGVIARVRQLSSADEVAVSPATWHATSPAWSADGDNLVWVANAAELLEGPAAVVVAPVGDPDAVRVVVGSGNGALHQFPAFPDLPLVPVGMDP